MAPMAVCGDIHHPNPGNRLIRVLSTENPTETRVTFVNSTDRSLDVIWVDYHGSETTYMTLTSGGSYEQHTFVTHAWKLAFADTHGVLGYYAAVQDPSVVVVLGVNCLSITTAKSDRIEP